MDANLKELKVGQEHLKEEMKASKEEVKEDVNTAQAEMKSPLNAIQEKMEAALHSIWSGNHQTSGGRHPVVYQLKDSGLL
jgi:F0F1-type ATP synthase membrane subunit b/b'